MAKFRNKTAAGADPLGRIVQYLLPVLVFLSVTAISRRFAIGMAAVCLVLSLGKAAFVRLRGRVSLLTIAVVVLAVWFGWVAIRETVSGHKRGWKQDRWY